jgi:uncharacterized surface protein with fasciclin (FAS1) repeats
MQVILPANKFIPMSNLTQVVNTDKNLKTLKKGMHASDMDQILSSSGPYTFFAPDDPAFEKLEKGMMETMLEPRNRPQLAELMKNHIVSGKILLTDLKDGDLLKTINNKELKVEAKEGNICINNVTLTQSNLKATNGALYFLDTVLVN